MGAVEVWRMGANIRKDIKSIAVIGFCCNGRKAFCPEVVQHWQVRTLSGAIILYTKLSICKKIEAISIKLQIAGLKVTNLIISYL